VGLEAAAMKIVHRYTGATLFDTEAETLSEADLRGADLRGADLRGADLSVADLREANLPPPPSLLLAWWGEVSDELCRDLMRYDAANHPDPQRFDVWAGGGGCPMGGIRWQRAANFQESRALWSPGPAPSALSLVLRLFAEKGIQR